MWFALIFVMGVALRLYRLESQSLWVDEAIQYSAASAASIREVIKLALEGATPPLSHLINHFFFRAGDSDFLLRLPSALFGIGSLPLIFILARRLASIQTALVTTLLFALSPFHLWYSQDARMYSQLRFFSLAGAILLLKAAENGKLHLWALYFLTVFCGLATAEMGTLVLKQLWKQAGGHRFERQQSSSLAI